MAIVDNTISYESSPLGTSLLCRWENLQPGDEGEPVYLAGARGVSIQEVGFDGVQYHSSNDGGINWKPYSAKLGPTAQPLLLRPTVAATGAVSSVYLVAT